MTATFSKLGSPRFCATPTARIGRRDSGLTTSQYRRGDLYCSTDSWASSGLQVSAIGLGTNNFGRRLDAAATERVVHAALDAGVNMIDTSNSYGDGDSEEFIGRALKGRRHEAALCDERMSSRVSDGPNNAGNSQEAHLRPGGCEPSEAANGLPRSVPDSLVGPEHAHRRDAEGAGHSWIRAGKVRYAGCSNFAAWQVCESHWTAKTLGINGFVSMQPHYSDAVPAVRKRR